MYASAYKKYSIMLDRKESKMPPDYIRLIIVAEMTERINGTWKKIAFSFEDLTDSYGLDLFQQSINGAEKDLLEKFSEFADYNYQTRIIQKPESMNHFLQYCVSKNGKEGYACDWLNYVITNDSVNSISKGKMVFQPE